MMIANRPLWIAGSLLIASFLLLTGCEGGEMTGGGVGGTGTGTGIGTISGFQFTTQGSQSNLANPGIGRSQDITIVLNNNRHLTVNDATILRMDRLEVGIWDLVDRGAGLVASVIIGEDHNNPVTQAIALKVSINHWLIGPVTATSQGLKVLGQPVLEDRKTVLTGVSRTGSLNVADLVEVSGFADASNQVQASQIAKQPNAVPFWKLTGPINAIAEGVSITIGQQVVSLNNISPLHCGEGYGVGDMVEVLAEPNLDFRSGSPLERVYQLHCLTHKLEVPVAPAGDWVLAEMEGVIFSADLPTLWLGGQPVFVSKDTQIIKGGSENLMIGARLLVQGLLDPNSGILFAGKISFVDGN